MDYPLTKKEHLLCATELVACATLGIHLRSSRPREESTIARRYRVSAPSTEGRWSTSGS